MSKEITENPFREAKRQLVLNIIVTSDLTLNLKYSLCFRRFYVLLMELTQSRQLPELFRITLFILKAGAARNIKCNTATLKPPRERDKLRDDHKMVKAWMNFNWSLNSLALLCEMIWLFSSP